MKNTLFSALASGYGTYKGARKIVTTVVHPIRWVRRKIWSRLVRIFLSVALSAVRDDQKAVLVEKASGLRKIVRFSVPIPKALHRNFSEDDRPLKLLHEMANDAMALPLALIGYRLGMLQVSWDAEAGQVRAVLELGISSTEENRDQAVSGTAEKELSGKQQGPEITRP